MQFRLGELFCGPGGLALGAAIAEQPASSGAEFGIKHVWGVDKDEMAIATYETNIAARYGGVGVHENVTTFCESMLGSCSPIDALAFGFPCNDFSSVGEGNGLSGNHGLLYKAGVVALNHFSPEWFVAENVSGIAHADTVAAFRQILSELSHAGRAEFGGYQLTVHLYKFEQYGVPQTRHRYIIVGIRRDKGLRFLVPKPTHDGARTPFVSARQAMERPFTDGPYNHAMRRVSDRVRWRLILTPPGENAWKLDEIVEWSDWKLRHYVKQMPWYAQDIAPLGPTSAIRDKILYAKLEVESARMSHIYKRLTPDLPSYTVTGSGGGGTHIYHWAEHRSLTDRERARLQSFPDWFRFEGGNDDVRRQIGMAVPPTGAKHIFEAILKTFAGVEYPAVDASWTG